MIVCVLINGTMAFAIILVLLYCIGPPDAVLDTSYPIIPICLNDTGSMKAINTMESSLIIVTYFVVAASVASVSSITWPWARDGALPGGLAEVSVQIFISMVSWCTRLRTNERASLTMRTDLPKVSRLRQSDLAAIVIGCLLALLNVGSTTGTAFSVFTALSSLGLYTSYIIAISCILRAWLTGRLSDKPGAAVQYGGWRMWDGFATPVNVFALLWTIYLTIWLAVSDDVARERYDMNYAVPVYGFVVLVAAGVG